MAAAVEIEGLWEGYRPKTKWGRVRRHEWHWALRDVSLEVAAGEALGVVGGNGSGKTTLLRCVAGVIRPTRGQLRVHGRVSSLIDLAAGVSRDLTGHENLVIGGVLLGLTRAELKARYDDIVAFSGLPEEVLSEPLHTYSQGMLLRQVFSVVLHSQPSVLLVDEVLAVADDAFRAASAARIEELRARGCAVILVSHDLDLVAARCERVGLLDAGSLLFVGQPEEALARYGDLLSAAAASGSSRPWTRHAGRRR